MLSDKKLAKIEKILGKDKIVEIEQGDLQSIITNASASIKQAQDELAANPQYQELKESLKALSAGLKEIKQRQNAIIEYALHTIEERGV